MFQFNELPALVKNIIIINIIFYVATVSLASLGINLVDYFGLHQIQSSKFLSSPANNTFSKLSAQQKINDWKEI